jgi:hypothetical protein
MTYICNVSNGSIYDASSDMMGATELIQTEPRS